MTKTCLECGKVFEHEVPVMVMALVISHECEKENESEGKS